jgi:transcriptional regulator with XRE-family HTH domain
MGTRMLSNRLRDYRDREGWSLVDASGLTGYSVPFLSRVERGERNLTPAGRVHVARCFGCRVEDIFDPPVIEDEDVA